MPASSSLKAPSFGFSSAVINSKPSDTPSSAKHVKKKKNQSFVSREQILAVAMATRSTSEREGQSPRYLPLLSPFFLIKDRDVPL